MGFISYLLLCNKLFLSGLNRQWPTSSYTWFSGLVRQLFCFTWCLLVSLMWLHVQGGFSQLRWMAVMARGQVGHSPLLRVISLFSNLALISLYGGWILRKSRSCKNSKGLSLELAKSHFRHILLVKASPDQCKFDGRGGIHIQGRKEFLVAIFCDILPQGNRCLEFSNKRISLKIR